MLEEKFPADFLEIEINALCKRTVELRRQWLVFHGEKNFVSQRAIDDLKNLLRSIANNYVNIGEIA